LAKHKVQETLFIKKLLFADNIIKRDRCSKDHLLVDNYQVNVLNLKIMAFLTCRGHQRAKANILYDIIWGERHAAVKRRTIQSDKPEMIAVFQKIFFFAEIYPMRFLDYFREELKAENVERKH
jgi:hypothetical protein